MPFLSLRFEGEWVKGYLLKDGATLTIGRSQNNDVVIENLGVSKHHAKIDGLDGRFLLTDLQSKNGTFVNNELVTSHWLQHGDAITIGKHVLHFDVQEGEPPIPAPPVMEEKTLIMDTDQYQALLASSYEKSKPEEIQKEEMAVLTFIAGGIGEHKLTKKMVNIGKGNANDIVVGGLFVGKVAAGISQRPAGYYLSYLGGWSKPKVNGKTITQSVKLEDFDIIQIGSAKMQFMHRTVYKK